MSDTQFPPAAISAARLFRDILAAMASPGERITLRMAPAASGGLQAGSLALITTLCDYQTPVFLAPRLALPEAVQQIRFETGAPITTSAPEAAFALVAAEGLVSSIGTFARGTHEYPDRSTTVIVQLDQEGPGATVAFSGPGISAPRLVSLPGIDAAFWEARAAINADYPLGLDFIFVAGGAIIACPRTTKTRLREHA